jgi:glycine cleavage system H protein
MYPDDLKYTQDHEWIRAEDGDYTVGITAYAADQLGDVTYVELPENGDAVVQGGDAATVESVKAASDVYAPVAGEVLETNAALEEKPELLNEDPYGDGWIFKLTNVNASEVKALMNAAAYEEFLEGLE